MRRATRYVPILALLLTGWFWAATGQPEQGTDERYLLEAFGDRIRHDPQMSRQALQAGPDVLIPADEDGDGGLDAFYFVDGDARHFDGYRPIVVKALAPSGNFPNNRLNMTHVLLVADWRGDGHIDGDIDRMLMTTPFRLGPMHMVMAEDVSDDNRLWFHRNYQYDIASGWWRSDWNGDEAFFCFGWDPARRTWIPRTEAPFAFYDTDGDGYADEALRLESLERNVASFRYSFDVDRDANPYQPHDYDFSLTGIGPATIPESLTVRTRIGLWQTEPFLPWDRARAWVRQADWRSVALTWDEIDNNVDLQTPNRFGEGERHAGFRNERWEGVLNHPTESFPQVGGPSAGPFNRRTEVDLDNSGRMQLYYSPVDRRIHLRGAETGFQRVDFNLDGRMDMEIRFGDRNSDGYLDYWEVDVDGDGIVDRSYGFGDRMTAEAEVQHEPVPADLHSFYIQRREQAISDSVALIEQMRVVLRKYETGWREDEAERFFRDQLRQWQPEHGLGEKMRASRETERFYSDIVRERYFHRILQLLAKSPGPRRELLKQYGRGNYQDVGARLREHFREKPEVSPPQGLLLAVTNPSTTKLWRFPVVVDLRSLKAVHSGINVYHAVPSMVPDPVPSQVDDLDGDGAADELVFAVNLEPGETQRFRIQWQGPAPSFPATVRSSSSGRESWWDSGFARFSISAKGEILFTGKRMSILDNRPGLDPEPGDHAQRPVLQLDSPVSLQVVREGPVRAVLRSADASLLVMTYAGQAFSEIRYRGASGPLGISFPAGERRQLSPRVSAVEHWDGDIGVAAIWPNSAERSFESRRRILHLGGSDARIWIYGYWRSGDRKPFWPTRSNRLQSLDHLSQGLSSPPSVSVVKEELR